MELAVVIPAVDEAARIGAAVASARGSGVEVIVVDGGSRDGTAARAREAGARVISGPSGRARQLRAGCANCAADAILLLHADTRLPAGFERAVREALSDPATVGGSFALRFDRRAPALRVIEWGAALRRALLGLPYGDQALFARRSALEAAGGVPEVAFLEDLDLVRALRRQGRLARLRQPVTTSARRYLESGVLRTMLRNWGALIGWRLGLDRARLARWYAR